MARKTVCVIFTHSYPTANTEKPFLGSEIKYLEEAFDEVHLVPQNVLGEPLDLPSEVKLDVRLAESLCSMAKLIALVRVFCSAIFYLEIIRSFRVSSSYLALKFLMRTYITRRWVDGFVDSSGVDKNYVFYSFWQDSATYGALMAGRGRANLKVVSRCHNYDLYKTAENYFYVPFQSRIIKELDLIVPDSREGLEFLKEAFPLAKSELGLMGVEAPLKVNAGSRDGVFRIMTCAYLCERKRIILLAKALAMLGSQGCMSKIHWYHVGEGPLLSELKLTTEKFPKQIQVSFLGNMDYTQLIDFYQETPLDLHVNTSYMEGTAVSMIEALSYGLPILATAVGGATTIVSNENGALLSPDPSIDEIADELEALLKNPEKLGLMRRASREIWSKLHSAEKNYGEFALRLKALYEMDV
ncbi:MAG: glycosyltransferase [Lentisphaeraceae bacterium]|nr:glycosyltransferase [Lentisphaeraceae bacterium]